MHRLLFLIPSLGGIAQELARVSYSYRAPILLITVAVSATFAAIMLSSREARWLAGSWVNYIGWAFIAYSFQYFFRLLGWFLQDAGGRILQVACNFLANVGSGTNNLFFLVAAFVLLNKRDFLLPTKRGSFRPADLTRPSVLTPIALIVLIPAAFTTTANVYFVETESPWSASLARLPDALITAFCLGLVSYAMMRNFLTHYRRYWATGVILVGLVYSSVQLLYAASPVWADLRSAEIRVVLQSAPSPKPSEPVEFLDSTIFTLALPLKMLLFVPAVFLFFTLVIAAHDFRKVLRVVTEWKRSYLSNNGIMAAIGQSVAADRVELFIKLPGEETPSAWCIPWPHRGESPYCLLLDEAADPRLLAVFDGREQVPRQHSGEMPPQIHTSAPLAELNLQVMLPVKFHGAVVGCLKVTFGHRGKFSYAALQQLRSMADLLALAVNEYRALASLDQLSDRLARLRVQPSTDFVATTRDMALVLHDVLSPLATGLVLEAGFRPSYIFNGADELRGMLQEQAARYESRDVSTRVVHIEAGGGMEAKVFTNHLTVTPRGDSPKTFQIGELVLVLPSQRDEINRPTLGDYDLYRRTVASHTADAFLDLVRDHLNYELNGLSIRLNAEELTQDEWLRSIQMMAGFAGLLWVGVTQAGGNRVLGEREFAERILPKLDEGIKDKLEGKPISCAPFRDDATGTRHILRVELKKSGHQVWFGIAREGFGFELEFPSPWRSFLKDFSEIVDSSLTTLFEIEKSKEKVAKMAEELAVMNIALTTGHLMHQLANKVDEQLFPAESLWEAAGRGDIKADDAQMTQIEAILGGARVMKRLVSIFKNVTSTNRQRPCSLREVVVQALKFQEQVGKSGVRLENRVADEEFWIDVPYNVAVFAITNLVSNSKDAIAERRKQAGDAYAGEIRIEAESNKQEIICYVEDNGSGIPPYVKEKLYTLGTTGKPPHNGWGLYFTKHSLSENGASIELVDTGPHAGTKFRLRFPKVKSA
jgi:hypothetical protein